MARVQFYMHDWYGLNMSRQQQIFSAWHRMYPPGEWEITRDQRIARIMGHSNPYVTGERTWKIGQRPSADGLRSMNSGKVFPAPIKARAQVAAEPPSQGKVIGNRNSRVFHLPTGCPSYGQVSQANSVYFNSPEEAIGAGFRLAGNCR